MMYSCGEKPGSDRYVCTHCGEDVYLDEETDALPPCAGCAGCDFTRE